MCARVLSCFSRVWLFATLSTVAHQAPLSMGFSRQEYQSGLPCPPPGDLSHPRDQIRVSYVSCIGRFFTTSTTFEAQVYFSVCVCLVAQSCPTLCNPMPTLVLCPWGFFRQEHWSRLPYPCWGYGSPSPGDLPKWPGMNWLTQLVNQSIDWPRDQSQVSHISFRFFIIWATREAHISPYYKPKEVIFYLGSLHLR